jgi:NRAMP (natural resistance-associated macrophage protein)-like metal ion transporter
VVTGAADDDPSGIGTYSQVGAASGFGLLWTTIVTLPLAAAVQETAARLGITTGQGLATSIKHRYPPWVLYVAVALVTTANVFNIGADLGSMASSIRLLLPAPFAVVIVAVTGAMVGLEITISYRRYARVLRWLTASLVTYVAVLFVIKVDWGLVLRSTIVPALTWSRAELAAIIAILGTTISPYLFFWQASEEVEEAEIEGTPPPTRSEPVDDHHVAAMRGDVVAGMGSAVVVMFAIMVASATALHEQGTTTVQTAQQAASALKPVAGSFASLLFTLGIVGTGALAVPVLAGSAAYAIAEAFGWHEGLSKTFHQARGFYLVIAASMAIGLAMDFGGLDPIRGLYFAAILNGLAAPPLILVMMLLSNDERTVGRWLSGSWSNALVGLAFAAMVAAPIAYLLA